MKEGVLSFHFACNSPIKKTPKNYLSIKSFTWPTKLLTNNFLNLLVIQKCILMYQFAAVLCWIAACIDYFGLLVKRSNFKMPSIRCYINGLITLFSWKWKTKLILLVSRRPGGGGERHKRGPSQSSDLPFAWRDSKG